MYLGEFDRLWMGGGKGPVQMISELNRIIGNKRIVPHFQPIISIADGKLFGFEALSRIEGESCFANIEELFTAARQFGMLTPLEFLCREKAIIKAAQLGTEGRLFLNVCPAVLASDHRPGVTAELLGKLGIDRSRVVLEITEKSLINDYDLFNRVVSHYRQQGYAIAIDDLGDGYAGLKMLAQLEPDYVKLARFLVDGIDRSYVRQALVEAIVGFCGRTGIDVIAEGIEQPEELAYLQQVGVTLGQGYLIGRPSSRPDIPDAFLHLPQTVPEVAISL